VQRHKKGGCGKPPNVSFSVLTKENRKVAPPVAIFNSNVQDRDSSLDEDMAAVVEAREDEEEDEKKEDEEESEGQDED
jgi:hypothetical protein